MSDLTVTRDHARRMAKTPGPDQALWTQIADEIDAYLAGPGQVVDLFGGASAEPARDWFPDRCPDCQWVELRTLEQVEPDIVRGQPCKEHE